MKLHLDKISVHLLRQNKFKVRVTHRRRVKVFDKDSFEIKTLLIDSYNLQELRTNTSAHNNTVVGGLEARGGQCDIDVTCPDGSLLEGIKYSAVEVCSPEDNYCRSIGVSLGLRKIIQQIIRESDSGRKTIENCLPTIVILTN